MAKNFKKRLYGHHAAERNIEKRSSNLVEPVKKRRKVAMTNLGNQGTNYHAYDHKEGYITIQGTRNVKGTNQIRTIILKLVKKK